MGSRPHAADGVTLPVRARCVEGTYRPSEGSDKLVAVRRWAVILGILGILGASLGCGLEPLERAPAPGAPAPIVPSSQPSDEPPEAAGRPERWDSLGAPSGDASACRAHWTGTELLLWAPAACEPHRLSREEPSAMPIWAPMSTPGAPPPNRWWAGTAMGQLIVYGYSGEDHTVARYDPATDHWSASAPFTLGHQPEAITALSTDDKLVLWGGFAHDELDPEQIVMPRFATFDPSADDWRPMSQEAMATPRHAHGAVWDSHHMFVFGGYDYAGNLLADGGVYDDGSQGWETVLAAGAPSPRVYPAVAWTGHIYVVFGGTEDGTTFLADGGRYCPEPCWAWSEMAEPEGFAPRHPVAHWAGEEVIVLQTADAPLAMARYEPELNRWTPVSLPSELDDFVLVDAHWDWATYQLLLWGRHGCETAGCEPTGPMEAWIYEPPLTVDVSDAPGSNLAGNQKG